MEPQNHLNFSTNSFPNHIPSDINGVVNPNQGTVTSPLFLSAFPHFSNGVGSGGGGGGTLAATAFPFSQNEISQQVNYGSEPPLVVRNQFHSASSTSTQSAQWAPPQAQTANWFDQAKMAAMLPYYSNVLRNGTVAEGIG